MTYWSSTSRISRGLGRWLRADCAFSSSSSRMMSLHSSTHSSQMNTLGPAISLRTSCWLFPQNEQYRILLLSPVRPGRSSVIPRYLLQPRVRPENSTGAPIARGPAGRDGKAVSARTIRRVRTVSRRLDGLFRTPLEHFVDQAVLARGFGALEVVAFGVAGDGVQRLSGVLGQDLVE